MSRFRKLLESNEDKGSQEQARKSLKALIAKQRGRVTNSMLILSVAWMASSYWTFNGLMMTAQESATAGFTGAVQALIASVVSAVVVAGCCSMLLAFSGAGDGHDNRTRRLIILALSLAPFVLGISTIMAIKGLTMGPALYFDMEERAEAWLAYAEHRESDPAAARSVADTLAPIHKGICTTADLETSQGLITGSRGKGAVSAALVSACTGLDAIVGTLERTAQSNARRADELKAQLDALKDIPEQEDLSIFARQDAFRMQVGRIKAALAEGGAENLRERVGAQVAMLSNSVIQLETQEGTFGARQITAVAALKGQLREVERIVRDFLGQSAAEKALAEPADLLSSGAAIQRWWPRMIPQILLAVGVDLAILWMAAFLAFSRASLRESQNRHPS